MTTPVSLAEGEDGDTVAGRWRHRDDSNKPLTKPQQSRLSMKERCLDVGAIHQRTTVELDKGGDWRDDGQGQRVKSV